MSEQVNPPKGQKPAKTPPEKNTLRMNVILEDEKPEKKVVKTPPRKKVSVTNAAMQVHMPGELKSREEKILPASVAKPKEPVLQVKIDAPKPVVKKRPSSEPQKNAKVKKTAKLASPVKKSPETPAKNRTKPSSTKRVVVSTKRSPIPRATVVPPKIGSRRGYRPTLAFRMQFPVFLISFLICAIAIFFTFHKEVGPVGRYVASAMQSSLVELTVEPGMSAKAVSLLLKQHGVVDDDQALLQFFIDSSIATTLRSGSFVMERGMAYKAIGKQLTSRPGELVLEVSPAFTLATIDRYLENREYAKSGEFLKATEALKQEYSLSFVEGWLLSGEYTVPKEGAASALTRAMFDAMLSVLQPYLGSGQIEEWGVEQTLIIASMIQAETQDVEQMPLIASVIYNRLKAGEPLGIDATTRYEIDDWKNPIPKKALETQTPYNTRRKVGLPPSGICCPSRAAVEAALFPLESPFFYYLHGKDKRIHPAITYDEHKENIKKYL